jgi:hypothetical protein
MTFGPLYTLSASFFDTHVLVDNMQILQADWEMEETRYA